jgi:hypothetical protein
MALKREKEAMRQKILMLETLVHHLRNTPEEIAHDTFQKLRATSDIHCILPTLNPILQNKLLADCTTPYGFLPSVYSFHDLELEAQHPNAYPQLDSFSTLLQPPKRAVHSTKRQRLMKEAITDTEDSGSSRSSSSIAFLTSVPGSNFLMSRPESNGATVLYPQDIPRLVGGSFDSALEKIDILLWTSVPVTNSYAAGAISLYLATDHPLLGVFDAELFVDDLIAGTLGFCSPFLVSSLLAFASVSMSVLYYLFVLMVFSKVIHLEIQLLCLAVTISRLRQKVVGRLKTYPIPQKQLLA